MSVLADPARTAELEISTLAIAGENGNSELQELASYVAAAQIDLVRVRQARHHVISRALNDPNDKEPNVELLANVIQKLIAFDRYERRVLSRRKFAIRAFDMARARIPCGTKSRI